MRSEMSDGRRETGVISREQVNMSKKLLWRSKKRTRFTSAVCRLTTCLLLTVSCLLYLSGCDESFQPLQENKNAPFSIFGYLDASADTQWVRVTPVREQLDQPPVKPEMDVTLEHLQSGSMAEMNDSLFLFPDGFHILNAWTTTDIEPGQTYRLEANRPDGAASHVTVTLPDDFPTPRLLGEGCNALLIIKGVERVADVQYRWHVRISRPGLEYETFWSAPYRSRIRRVSPDEHRLNINFITARNRAAEPLETLPANTTVEVLDRHIFVAAGGPEWVDNEELASIGDLEYALPDVFSNVENGFGYMVGIVSKIIPDEQQCP